MKKFLILISLFLNSIVLSQGWEIDIINHTSHNNNLKVKIYPVSMIFNGTNEYNLFSRRRWCFHQRPINIINLYFLN